MGDDERTTLSQRTNPPWTGAAWRIIDQPIDIDPVDCEDVTWR
jgi:hypothetical protein